MRIAAVDLETGELLGTPIWIPRRIKAPWRYAMINQEALESIASDPDIRGETYRVFLYLISKLDWENYIYVPQRQICEALGMRPSNVSRAIRSLLDKGILHRAPEVGNMYAFRLNPYYGWKGKVINMHRNPRK